MHHVNRITVQYLGGGHRRGAVPPADRSRRERSARARANQPRRQPEATVALGQAPAVPGRGPAGGGARAAGARAQGDDIRHGAEGSVPIGRRRPR